MFASLLLCVGQVLMYNENIRLGTSLCSPRIIPSALRTLSGVFVEILLRTNCTGKGMNRRLIKTGIYKKLCKYELSNFFCPLNIVMTVQWRTVR